MQLLFTISVAIFHSAYGTCYDYPYTEYGVGGDTTYQCDGAMSGGYMCVEAADGTCKYPDETFCGTDWDETHGGTGSMQAKLCNGASSPSGGDRQYCDMGEEYNGEHKPSWQSFPSYYQGTCHTVNICGAGCIETVSPGGFPGPDGLDGYYKQRECCCRADADLGTYAAGLDGEPGWGLQTVCGREEFIDSDGCDLFRHRFKCVSASSANNGKCVEYTHDGQNCKSEAFHAIPKCEDLDMISYHDDEGEQNDIKALTPANQPYWNRTFSDAQQSGDYAGQGMRGWHFCQRSNKCYHPQAATSGAGAVDSNGTARNKLPTPTECPTCDITDRCDDYAGVAGTEQGNKPGDKGNWRDHIFEAPNKDHFGTHDKPDFTSCAKDYNDPAVSKSCLVHSLPKTNSYESITQCAHGKVEADNCNGVTFYFNVEGRGHNFQFNFCRHGDATAVESPNAGASIDGEWISNPLTTNQNQWVKR